MSGDYNLANSEKNTSRSSNDIDMEEACGEQFVTSKQEPLKMYVEADLKYIDSPDVSDVEGTCKNFVYLLL